MGRTTALREAIKRDFVPFLRNKGFVPEKQTALIGGINTRDGKLTCRAVAEAHGLKYEEPL